MGDPWSEGGFSGDDEWEAEEIVEAEDEDGEEDEDELALDLEELGKLEGDEPEDVAG